MMVLYKYMKREYARLLLDDGVLRIGTLYDYRDIEKHGGVTGDDSEGKKSLRMEIDNEVWEPQTQPDFTKEAIKLEGLLQLKNLNFVKIIESLDCYLFCATKVFDQNTMRGFGHDACVVIENPKKFFVAISRLLRKIAKFNGFFPCQYVSRIIPHDEDHGFHPAIIKETTYSSQKEVRALWSPKRKNISPFNLKCREASKYCRIFENFNHSPIIGDGI